MPARAASLRDCVQAPGVPERDVGISESMKSAAAAMRPAGLPLSGPLDEIEAASRICRSAMGHRKLASNAQAYTLLRSPGSAALQSFGRSATTRRQPMHRG